MNSTIVLVKQLNNLYDLTNELYSCFGFDFVHDCDQFPQPTSRYWDPRLYLVGSPFWKKPVFRAFVYWVCSTIICSKLCRKCSLCSFL